ncbi:MAG: phosphatase PAP2 family protein [Bacteroidales bacterium]|nr:phosphatase PAP2 family protein [Bacteroidales bacterium]
MEGVEQIVTIWDRLEAADRAATLWINGNCSQWSDPFWVFMSQIKIWIPLYVLVVALLIWRLGWKKGLIAVAAVALCFFCDERINNLIKMISERPRPCNDPGMIAAGIHVLEQGGGWSFPSGHACNSFGFAVSSAICLNFDKKFNWGWYTVIIIAWATLVGISRIMVACHFLGDVMVGTVIGVLMALLWARIARKACNLLPDK